MERVPQNESINDSNVGRPSKPETLMTSTERLHGLLEREIATIELGQYTVSGGLDRSYETKDVSDTMYASAMRLRTALDHLYPQLRGNPEHEARLQEMKEVVSAYFMLAQKGANLLHRDPEGFKMLQEFAPALATLASKAERAFGEIQQQRAAKLH